MSKDPFVFEGQTLWSFSGGRTSAYMLWRALQAYGGRLPDDHVVAFANTGKEREETLRFVQKCGSEWDVPIVWLEFRSRKGRIEDRFEVVGHNSASMNGEPFTALVAQKKYLPNATQRFCTEELKVNTVANYLRSRLGWSTWNNAVGLRHDEPARVMKSLGANHEPRKGQTWINKVPLANARITKRDVMEFWSSQAFDLQLKGYEGNCDLCFMKARKQLEVIIRENPTRAAWWTMQEQTAKGRFVTEFTYNGLTRDVLSQGHLFDGFIESEDFDAECGTWCATQ